MPVVVALVLALGGVGRAAASDVTAGSLVIHQPWARATPGGAVVGGGYLTIDNGGSVPDRLIGGSLEGASSFALHAMSIEGGIMRMRPTGPLEIPAGGSVKLAPGGQHIMFTGLKQALKAGQTVAGTLVFAGAGTVPVRFVIEAIGAREPMPGMDMR